MERWATDRRVRLRKKESPPRRPSRVRGAPVAPVRPPAGGLQAFLARLSSRWPRPGCESGRGFPPCHRHARRGGRDVVPGRSRRRCRRPLHLNRLSLQARERRHARAMAGRGRKANQTRNWAGRMMAVLGYAITLKTIRATSYCPTRRATSPTGLSKVMTLETKASVSRVWIRPHSSPIVPKSSFT